MSFLLLIIKKVASHKQHLIFGYSSKILITMYATSAFPDIIETSVFLKVN